MNPVQELTAASHPQGLRQDTDLFQGVWAQNGTLEPATMTSLSVSEKRMRSNI
jgi:hypothetical protein